MQLQERLVSDVVVVTITGDISLNQGGDVLLRDKVYSLLHQGHRRILLDVGAVSRIDSAGLGGLVHAYATTANRGGSLKLLNVTKRLQDLLVVTRLLTVFDTYESEAEALASFGPALV